jgi:hypothetical protein
MSNLYVIAKYCFAEDSASGDEGITKELSLMKSAHAVFVVVHKDVL